MAAINADSTTVKPPNKEIPENNQKICLNNNENDKSEQLANDHNHIEIVECSNNQTGGGNAEIENCKSPVNQNHINIIDEMESKDPYSELEIYLEKIKVRNVRLNSIQLFL